MYGRSTRSRLRRRDLAHDRSRDVVIIGGGHNGLVAAAYLARAGLSTVVCERRDVVGGAAVSEHPFGPGLHGYVAVVRRLTAPAGSGQRPAAWSGMAITSSRRVPISRRGPTADTCGCRTTRRSGARRSASSRPLTPLPTTPTRRTWPRIGAILGPMLTEIPPRLGSRQPAGPAAPGAAAAPPEKGGHQGGSRHHQAADRQHRRPAGRLLRERCAPRPAVSLGCDRHLGRPALGWQRIRDAASSSGRRRRPGGRVGLPARRHGRRHRRSGRRGQVVRRGDPHRRAGRPDQDRGGRADRRDAGQRRGDRRGHGDHHCAPEDLLPRPARSRRAASRLRRRHPRLAFPQRHRQDQSGGGHGCRSSPVTRTFDPQVHGGTIVLAESLDDLENAFQDAAAGQPAAVPFADICIPSVFDDCLAPAGPARGLHVHPVGAAYL